MTKAAKIIELDSVPGSDAEPERRTLRLDSGRRVVVHSEAGGEELLEVSAPDGRMLVRIRLTESGPVLVLEGVRLELKAVESVTLDADRVEINAREEALVRSEGALKLESAGELSVRSEDDIRATGKTIHLN